MQTIIDLINAMPDDIRLTWMHTPIAHILYDLLRLFHHIVFEDGSVR